MIYISICITLLTLIAAMYLLAKSKKEELGSLFKWISYGIIAVSILLLVCQLTRGACRMMHCGKEKCGPEMGMHRGMERGMMNHEMCGGRGGEEMECREGGMMRGGDCGEKMECKGHMKSGCEGMKGCEGEDDDDDDAKDSSMHAKH
ncbi:MAG: hypothetical protein WCO54_06745 [Bacteroidota bacterium]